MQKGNTLLRLPQDSYTIKDAYERIQNCLLSWEILDITGAIVLEAVRGVLLYQMAYWDTQIWASARMNQIRVVFSEDFGTEMVIEGLRFVNPFDSNFNMEAWFAGLRTI